MHQWITHPGEPNEQHLQWKDGASLSLFYQWADNKHISTLNKSFALKIANRTLEIKYISNISFLFMSANIYL